MSKAKKIIIRVLLIIFVIISILSIIFTVFTLASITSAKKEVYNLGGVISKDDVYGVSVMWGLDRDVLRIISPLVDSNYGRNLLLYLDNDGVVSDENINSNRFDLTAQKSGNCVVAIERWDNNGIFDVNIYDITVDENLRINYAYRKVYEFPFYQYIDFSKCEITVQTNDSSVILSDDTAIKLRDEINRIYGKTSCCTTAPYLSDCVKIIRKGTHWNGADFVLEFYISEDKIYYQPYIEDETWYEFTPDEFFSFDGINELLDLKD